MLTIYLVALAVGGTLLIASLLMGGDHDAEVDTDVDAADVDAAEVDAEQAEAGFDVYGWFPVGSLRFWVFFLAFGGLAGLLFTVTGTLASELLTAMVAIAIGYLAGVGVVLALRRAGRSQSDSAISADDFVGATAKVVIAVGPGKTGKVRLDVRGRVIELFADTDEETLFCVKDSVLVYGTNDRGHALITNTDKLRAPQL